MRDRRFRFPYMNANSSRRLRVHPRRLPIVARVRSNLLAGFVGRPRCTVTRVDIATASPTDPTANSVPWAQNAGRDPGYAQTGMLPEVLSVRRMLLARSSPREDPSLPQIGLRGPLHRRLRSPCAPPFFDGFLDASRGSPMGSTVISSHETWLSQGVVRGRSWRP